MPAIPMRGIIEKIATELLIDKKNLIKESLKTYLNSELRKIESEMFKLGGRYNVTSAKEIDKRYKNGTLEEEDTWEDFFKLDHLEFKKKQILKALEEIR
ncbi:MAG: hypothetical protein ABIF11_07940 [Nitrospirota bacterium]